jgi:hypothetical protein
MSKLLNVVSLFSSVLLATQSLASQSPLHEHSSSKNVTLNFDDLPTHNSYGNITSYRHLNFSSFALINITSAASSNLISINDTYCAQSPHNALTANRAKTPSLWPRITLDPLAHALPGEAPFFSLHGLAWKPMNVSSSMSFICIFITAYGLDAQYTIRAYDDLVGCGRPQSLGGYIGISDVFPWWGRAVNMVEMHVEALFVDGEDEEWVDWEFCVDDLKIGVFDGEREWPETSLPKIIPLLPPPAPFKFEDEELRRTSRKDSPFREAGRAGFENWRANGAHGMFLCID